MFRGELGHVRGPLAFGSVGGVTGEVVFLFIAVGFVCVVVVGVVVGFGVGVWVGVLVRGEAEGGG